MSLYNKIHERFMFAREVSDALHKLDAVNDPKMRNIINRKNFINRLPEKVRGELPVDVQIGDELNPELDDMFIHPEDPMKAICESFVDRYIGNPFTSSELELNPLQLKILIYALSSQSLGVLAPRGVGKSVSLALAALVWCFFCAKGEDAFIIAPTTNQTDKVFSYVTDFVKTSKGNMLMKGDPSIGYEGIAQIKFGQKPIITWEQGSRLRPACASRQNKGETMRGQQPTFALIDESSYIIDDIYLRTIKSGLVSNRSDHAIPIIESGTPDAKNHFFDLFNDPKQYKEYMKIRFDYKDGIRAGRYTQEAIDKIVNETPGGRDSPEFQSEYMCIFPEANITYFRNMDAVFSNEQVELRPLPGMRYVAGLDLGRKQDSTVLTIGRYTQEDDADYVDVVHVLEIHANEDVTYPIQYQMICDELAKWNVQICYVDYTGPGIPIYESLKALGSKTCPSTTFLEFAFQGHTKYPAFEKCRLYFQNRPRPRIRYPELRSDLIMNHPDFFKFKKAYEEFNDIVQRRTKSQTEKGKFKVEPSRSRAHDDYVASCICLSKILNESYSNNLLGEVIKKQYNERLQGRKKGNISVVSPKRVISKNKHSSVWRKF